MQKPTRTELIGKGKELLEELRKEIGLPIPGYFIWGRTPESLERAWYKLLSELTEEYEREDWNVFKTYVKEIAELIRKEGWLVLALVQHKGVIHTKGWKPKNPELETLD